MATEKKDWVVPAGAPVFGPETPTAPLFAPIRSTETPQRRIDFRKVAEAAGFPAERLNMNVVRSLPVDTLSKFFENMAAVGNCIVRSCTNQRIRLGKGSRVTATYLAFRLFNDDGAFSANETLDERYPILRKPRGSIVRSCPSRPGGAPCIHPEHLSVVLPNTYAARRCRCVGTCTRHAKVAGVKRRVPLPAESPQKRIKVWTNYHELCDRLEHEELNKGSAGTVIVHVDEEDDEWESDDDIGRFLVACSPERVRQWNGD